MRASLLERLKQSNRPEATRAIARTAIFDTDPDIRYAAVAALKNRDKAQYDDVLMQGLRYPLPSGRQPHGPGDAGPSIGKDLLPKVAAFLDEAAPGESDSRQGGGQGRLRRQRGGAHQSPSQLPVVPSAERHGQHRRGAGRDSNSGRAVPVVAEGRLRLGPVAGGTDGPGRHYLSAARFFGADAGGQCRRRGRKRAAVRLPRFVRAWSMARSWPRCRRTSRDVPPISCPSIIRPHCKSCVTCPARCRPSTPPPGSGFWKRQIDRSECCSVRKKQEA